MATQIRKFEQEAIVDTIADKIETELKSKRTKMQKRTWILLYPT